MRLCLCELMCWGVFHQFGFGRVTNKGRGVGEAVFVYEQTGGEDERDDMQKQGG